MGNGHFRLGIYTKLSTFSIMRILLCILVFGFITSCVSKRDIFKSENIYDEAPLPYSIQVGSNLFYDCQEITNFGWLEYLYWNKRIYGDSSAAYKAALPEPNVFHQGSATDSILNANYLRHHRFHVFPVVGVSREQIESFSKWRSDRVMEYMLIRGKYMDRDTSQTEEQHFTIERLINGEIELKKPLSSITHYPNFRLPTQAEWMKAVSFADSAFSSQSERKKEKQTKGLELEAVRTSI